MNLYKKTISKSLILDDNLDEEQLVQNVNLYDYISNKDDNKDIIPKNIELIYTEEPKTLKQDDIDVDIIYTNKLKSKGDLFIKAKKNHVVKISNIKNRTIQYYKCEKNEIKLDPKDIKSYKIFIVETNVLLCNNKTINGIEIFIYNDSSEEIKINAKNHRKKKLEDNIPHNEDNISINNIFSDEDNISINNLSSNENKILINIIPPNEGKSFIYLHYLKKWIRC